MPHLLMQMGFWPTIPRCDSHLGIFNGNPILVHQGLNDLMITSPLLPTVPMFLLLISNIVDIIAELPERPSMTPSPIQTPDLHLPSNTTSIIIKLVQ